LTGNVIGDGDISMDGLLTGNAIGGLSGAFIGGSDPTNDGDLMGSAIGGRLGGKLGDSDMSTVGLLTSLGCIVGCIFFIGKVIGFLVTGEIEGDSTGKVVGTSVIIGDNVFWNRTVGVGVFNGAAELGLLVVGTGTSAGT
jgi:hypothetical protein